MTRGTQPQKRKVILSIAKMTKDGSQDVRIDVWLWRARFFKTRSIASEFISKRGIRITRNGLTRKTDKPGTRIMIGDTLTFGRHDTLNTLEVANIGHRRGPATEAAGLYNRLF